MKNKFFAALISALAISLISCNCAKAEQFFGIGAELFQDPFNKKVIITGVIPDSPVEKAGISAGSEIVSVDGFKVRKTCICDTVTRIRGEEGTSIKLVIRNGWKWKTYDLTREQITTEEPTVNENLEKYWRQVAPFNYQYIKPLDKEIADKFSLKYKKTVLPAIHYWLDRKANFELGYNTCMSYSKNNQELCLMNLLNRETAATNADKKLYEVLRNKPE